MIIAGRIFQFLLLVTLAFVTWFTLWRADNGNLPIVRPMPHLAAMREMVDRCAELNRPVVFPPGGAAVGGNVGADISGTHLASITILSEVAQYCAVTGAKLIVLACSPPLIPLYTEAVKEGYTKAGRLQDFDPAIIRYSTPELYSYAAWCAGTIRRENAGANFMIGAHLMESLILSSAGLDIGAMQIAGTTSSSQAPYFIATCDYTFLGPEMYAASAMISQDPGELGTLRGQDLMSLLVAILGVIGLFEATFGLQFLQKLYAW